MTIAAILAVSAVVGWLYATRMAARRRAEMVIASFQDDDLFATPWPWPGPPPNDKVKR